MGMGVVVHKAPSEPCLKTVLAALWQGGTHESISGLVHSSPGSKSHHQQQFHSDSCIKTQGPQRIKDLPFQGQDMGI